MESQNATISRRMPWNKGTLTGQKPPLKLRKILAIRTRLQMASNIRELAMFNFTIGSTLRACDLTRLQMQDIRHGSHVAARATVMQERTLRPDQFEIMKQTCESVEAGIDARGLKAADLLFLAGYIRRRICRRAMTPVLCIAGSHRLASTIAHMARTLCAVQKPL